jgi:hypothetical protein
MTILMNVFIVLVIFLINELMKIRQSFQKPFFVGHVQTLANV